MKLLKVLLRESPGAFLLAVLLGLFAGVVGMGLISQVNASLGSGAHTTLLWVFLSLCALRLFSSLVAQLQLNQLAQRSIQELRLKLTESVLRAPLRQLEKLGPSQLTGLLTDDVSALADGGHALAAFLAQLAFVVACCVYLCSLSVLAFVMVLLAFLGGMGVERLLDRRSETYFVAARGHRAKMYGGLRGITEGSKELKLHSARRDAFLTESIDVPGKGYRHGHIWGGGMLAATRHWFSLMFFLLVGLLLFAWPSLRPSDSPILVSYVLTVLYMQSILEGMLQLLPTLSWANTSLNSIEKLGLSIATNPEVADGVAPTSKTIELRDVVHDYEGEGGEGIFSLGPINLTLNPGEIVFVVGGNGSGKSTLIKVLTGLYAPQAGEIHIDGQSVTEKTRVGYRQLFSAVFSDWYLFDRLFGLDTELAKDDVQRYLGELRLDKKVNVKDGKFTTTALSQGQRKRLMLLTAYLEDRPVYVFDEWASDQDPIFKDVFYTQILKRLKERGKTVVVVSHDDRYFSVADRVVWLADGKMVAKPAAISTAAAEPQSVVA